jgi:hypothetical protein
MFQDFWSEFLTTTFHMFQDLWIVHVPTRFSPMCVNTAMTGSSILSTRQHHDAPVKNDIQAFTNHSPMGCQARQQASPHTDMPKHPPAERRPATSRTGSSLPLKTTTAMRKRYWQTIR